MSYFILIPLSIMFRRRDMMGMACDSSDLFGGLSTQHEPVNSSSLARSGLRVLGGHVHSVISRAAIMENL